MSHNFFLFFCLIFLFILFIFIQHIKQISFFFDIYRGKGVAEGKKSLAFSLELRADDRTLTDADCDAVTTKVLSALKDKLNAELR